MSFADLSQDVLDHVLSALPLQKLLAARATCRFLHARVQRRFLPVTTPPDLADLGELSVENHGPQLIRHFAEYLAWLRRWKRSEWAIRLLRVRGKEEEACAKEQEQRAQQSVTDGFFSLAPWWRAFGEVVPTPWQPEAWLQNANHAVADDASKSAFYQRRHRIIDDGDELFRLFYSTPAEAYVRQAMTTHIVLAPLDVRMFNAPAKSTLADLPTLSSAMQAGLTVAGQLLRAYLPTLRVHVEPMRTLEIDRSMTRGDRQDSRASDGKKVRQISSSCLHGARDAIDAALEEGEAEPFINFVVAPHLYPGERGAQFAWCYSTPLHEDFDIKAWVVSTHQIEAFVDPGPRQTRSLCNMLLYCVFMEAMGLEMCESAPCLMNNCDSVEESEQVPSMLCPTCFRKLHLMGVVQDVPGCHARVQQVLQQHQLS